MVDPLGLLRQVSTVQWTEQRLRDALEGLPFALWVCDAWGRYVFANAAARRGCGSEMIGKYLTEVSWLTGTLVTSTTHHLRVLAGEEVATVAAIRVKGKLRRFYCSLSPVRERDRICGCVGLRLDVTQLSPTAKQLNLLPLLSTLPASPKGQRRPVRGDDNRLRNEASPLTPREVQIVQLVAQGRTTKEVAEWLDISVKTAETHRVNLMRKLGIHCVGELVRYAIRHQLVEP